MCQSRATKTRGSHRFESLSIHLLGLLFPALMLGACATTSGDKVRPAELPDWVTGRPLQYPRQLYLIGVGHARTRQIAEKRAYAAVARVFEAKVEQVSKDFESYMQRSNGDTDRPQRQLN